MTQKTKKLSVNKSAKAGITLPVTRFTRIFKKAAKVKQIDRVAPETGVYCAAFCEYIIRTVLQKAVEVTYEKKRKQISIQDVQTAIHNNPDLDKLAAGKSILLNDRLPASVISNAIITNEVKKAREESKLNTTEGSKNEA
tara:strand:+ start:10560 stop:10979 length:420 start_codon:yes stop_codon:yes gene_type:complete